MRGSRAEIRLGAQPASLRCTPPPPKAAPLHRSPRFPSAEAGEQCGGLLPPLLGRPSTGAGRLPGGGPRGGSSAPSLLGRPSNEAGPTAPPLLGRPSEVVGPHPGLELGARAPQPAVGAAVCGGGGVWGWGRAGREGGLCGWAELGGLGWVGGGWAGPRKPRAQHPLTDHRPQPAATRWPSPGQTPVKPRSNPGQTHPR